MRKREIIKPNQRFNYLTIINYSHSDSRKRKWYNVVCDCGNTKKVMGSSMVSGNTKSCGCYASRYKKENNLLPNDLGVKRQIILQYKRHATRRNIDFKIHENDFIKLLIKPCYYCGLPPSNIKKTKNHLGFKYSGIDRFNNKCGYTKNNCVPCCEQCNKSKRDLSIDEFVSWIKRLHKAMASQWTEDLTK